MMALVEATGRWIAISGVGGRRVDAIGIDTTGSTLVLAARGGGWWRTAARGSRFRWTTDSPEPSRTMRLRASV